ncbi:magnesium transporter [Tepidibacter formicigenes]|jgi:magnesium transporter|uniref:Magnesium transporter MgtE n=1 Tax=Tepidibacter formicigenes DSM 15518 TaxID=1123349 RepID=A0A1M6T9M4_9FIRM|nr:magnesium transporter [Tepidibacter formicigenes]SHK53705.1 magnesium transporter [Tepidibacter formicigenes DSM 15518]
MNKNEILFEKVVVEVKALIDSEKIVELNEYLEELHPRDIAEILVNLEEDKKIKLFEVLPLEIGAKVLDELDSDIFSSILSKISIEHKKRILDLMSQDDMVDILSNLSEDKRQEIINLLDSELAEDIKELLVYKEDSAGGIMTTDFIALRKDITAYSAIEYLRENAPDAETIYYVYVIDKHEKLVGVISLRELIIAKPNSLVEDIMSEKVISVNVNDDQEEVAKLVSKYDFLAIPVTDTNRKLRGIITVDDIIDVIQEEATEDIYKFAGTSEAESEYLEEDKFFPKVIYSVKARLPWLLITLLGGTMSATILGKYESTISQYTAVSFFMPLLTGMGGNVGTQSSTLTVRGIATGHVDTKRAFKTIFQEMSVGASVGFVCSIIICIVAYLWMGDFKLGVVVGIAMAANMLTAATIGTVVPIVFKKLGVDPAVASAPFISTTLDITGLTIYFTLTTMLLLQIS